MDAGDVLPDWGPWSDAHDEAWIANEERLADERSRAMPADTLPEPHEPQPEDWRCRLCGNEVETPDDIGVSGRHIICLACYARQAEAEKRMPKHLRDEVSRIVNAIKP